MKNWIISIFLGVLFLTLWIKIVDLHEFLNYFEHGNLLPAVGFSVFYLLAYFFRSLRWRIILKPVTVLGYKESYAYFMSGMLINYLIPIRAGELAKSLILKSKKNIPVSASFPTIFIDKLSDFFPILLVLALVPILAVKLNSAMKLVFVLLILIFFILLFFVFFSVRYKNFAQKFINLFFIFFPRKIRNRLMRFSSSFIEGMAVMKSRKKDWLLVIFLTLLAVLSETFYVWRVFHSFSSNISFWKVLFGYTFMNLTYILPTPPAQVGSNQFMWTLIFGFGLGIDKNLASAVITFSHLLTGVIIFITGYLSLIGLKVNYKEIFSYK
jgi:uncharacterized protein (TIRG00374 family)